MWRPNGWRVTEELTELATAKDELFALSNKAPAGRAARPALRGRGPRRSWERAAAGRPSRSRDLALKTAEGISCGRPRSSRESGAALRHRGAEGSAAAPTRRSSRCTARGARRWPSARRALEETAGELPRCPARTRLGWPRTGNPRRRPPRRGSGAAGSGPGRGGRRSGPTALEQSGLEATGIVGRGSSAPPLQFWRATTRARRAAARTPSPRASRRAQGRGQPRRDGSSRPCARRPTGVARASSRWRRIQGR